MFKVIIAGGRDFDNFEILNKYCKKILLSRKQIEIVSGTAKGVDELGEQFAIENKLGLKSFPAPWKSIANKKQSEIGSNSKGKYWKKAGHFRNQQMANYSDALIAFWDGKSRGTKNMIDTAKKQGLLVRVFRYE